MAKPIRATELHYPMIQLLTKPVRDGEIFYRTSSIKASFSNKRPFLSNKPSFQGKKFNQLPLPPPPTYHSSLINVELY